MIKLLIRIHFKLILIIKIQLAYLKIFACHNKMILEKLINAFNNKLYKIMRDINA